MAGESMDKLSVIVRAEVEGVDSDSFGLGWIGSS